MDLSKLSQTTDSLNRVQNMARLNKGEQSIFPYDSYNLLVYSDDHDPPHFHLISKSEEFEVKVNEQGEVFDVVDPGKRSKNLSDYKDIEKNVKLWLTKEPANKDFRSLGTNLRMFKALWNITAAAYR